MKPRGWMGLAAATMVGACQSAAPAPGGAAPMACVDFAGAPALELPETRAPAALSSGKGQPYQFATALPVNRALAELAGWKDLGGGWSALQLTLSSANARSLSLHLSGVVLPGQSQLWLCSVDGKVRQGPLREAAGGELWTPVVPGSQARVELVAPTTAKSEFSAQLVEVFGAFR